MLFVQFLFSFHVLLPLFRTGHLSEFTPAGSLLIIIHNNVNILTGDSTHLGPDILIITLNYIYLLRLLVFCDGESLATSAKNEQFQLSIILDSGSTAGCSLQLRSLVLHESDCSLIHKSNPCCNEGITGGCCICRKCNTIRVSA